jgi:hypothetical protein
MTLVVVSLGQGRVRQIGRSTYGKREGFSNNTPFFGWTLRQWGGSGSTGAQPHAAPAAARATCAEDYGTAADSAPNGRALAPIIGPSHIFIDNECKGVSRMDTGLEGLI